MKVWESLGGIGATAGLSTEYSLVFVGKGFGVTDFSNLQHKISTHLLRNNKAGLIKNERRRKSAWVSVYVYNTLKWLSENSVLHILFWKNWMEIMSHKLRQLIYTLLNTAAQHELFSSIKVNEGAPILWSFSASLSEFKRQHLCSTS